MDDMSNGPGWWLSNDGEWYRPGARPEASPVQVPDAESIEPEPIPAGLPSPWFPPTPPAPSPVDSNPRQLGTQGRPQPELVGFVALPPAPTSSTTMLGPSRSGHRHRYPLVVAWSLAGVFFLSTVSLCIFSYHQTSAANQRRSPDVKTVAELAAAHSSIRSLNSQVSTLNGQVTSLNTQLAAQGTAKEKALDHDTALSQFLGDEGRISLELNTCVTDLQTLISTEATEPGNGNYGGPSLIKESDTASAHCTQAQSDEMVWRSLWRTFLSSSATQVMTRSANVPGREMADRLDRLTRELIVQELRHRGLSVRIRRHR